MKTRDANQSGRDLSSTMADLTDAASKEFFWGCELTKDKPSITWTFEEEEDDMDYLQHTLFLRNAVLGKEAKDNERNLIQIETKNFAGDELKQPLVSLTSGRSDMCQLDLNFHHEIPVTFRLIEGSGPVYLSAQQMVEFPKEVEDDECLTATETETEPEYSEEEEEVPEDDVKTKKRKAANGVAKGKKKRGKMDMIDEEEDDEDEDEDDEEEEEEEDEEEAEEAMETSEDEEEEEEDEEEEDMPKKKGRKGKATNGKAVKKGKAPAAKVKKVVKKGKGRKTAST